MTFPVFASGDVLNASDMNAVGLWLVKTQTIGTTVSSVQVTGAFSADYDAYRIIVSGGVGSTSADLNLTLGATATGYSRNIVVMTFGSATVTGAAVENTTSFSGAGNMSANNLSLTCDLINPFTAKRTHIQGASQRDVTTGASYPAYIGYLADTTSYTAFTITTASGTMTGGTIRVYGYRN